MISSENIYFFGRPIVSLSREELIAAITSILNDYVALHKRLEEKEPVGHKLGRIISDRD